MEPDRPALRSTKTRRRGWTAARQERFDELIGRYAFQIDDATHIDVLDIGVGHGETTLGSVRANPESLHVAVELHVPGVGRLLDALERHEVTSVRVVVGDAIDVLDALGDGSVGNIRVLFPDPWPKARHHGRRLIRPDVVTRFIRVLEPAGSLHLATDHAGYATWMHDVVMTTGRFIGGPVTRPAWRVDSRYSLRAQTAGRPVVDLCYELNGEVPRA